MSIQHNRYVLSMAVLITALFTSTHALAQSQPVTEPQPATAQGPQSPPSTPAAEDPLANVEKRLGAVEEWKTKIEKLPLLSNKVNF